MLDDNYTNVQLELDNIRARKHKFICLNDDMKFRNEKSIKAVHDFYESILPLPSSFELEYKKKNDSNSYFYESFYESTATPNISSSQVILLDYWLCIIGTIIIFFSLGFITSNIKRFKYSEYIRDRIKNTTVSVKHL